jgi:integrase
MKLPGSIVNRPKGSDRWSIILEQRDPVTGKRKQKWHSFKGTAKAAQKERIRLLHETNDGTYIEPSKLTVEHWIDQWIEAGAPGRKKKKVGQRTLERYEELLRVHVKPKLGARPLQKLQATEIDGLYNELEGKMAPMTLHHVHITFNSCLSTAERKGILKSNPMKRTEQVPSGGESDHGVALDETELATLVAGFKPSSLYPIVALDASTGPRRNEILAFRWIDHDPEKKTLKVERALEVTKKFGLRYKPPKTKRGLRTIALDDATNAMLLNEKEKHLRIGAGVPDGVDVDLSLVKLPADALMFPNVPEPGEAFSFTTPRNPRNFSKEFARRAALLGFADVRFHDLRGTHSTLLLDRGVPVHIVAERIGDDPAVLLRNYAKRKRKNTVDISVSAVISALAAGFLKA